MEPGEDFDQIGFAWRAAPQVPPADSGQGGRFGDDDAQPNSADREPGFRFDGAGLSTPTDDGAPPDALVSAE